MSRRNTIPEFTDDPKSMAVSLRAVKELLETLLGTRRRQGRVSQTFIEALPPDPSAGFDVQTGDFWIAKGTKKLHYWDGRLWQKIQP